MRWRLLSKTLHLGEAIATSSEIHQARTHLFLEIEHEGIIGFGEVSPQPSSLNGDPGFHDVLREFREFTMPLFRQVVEREAQLPEWFRVPRLFGTRSSAAHSSALLEAALLDLKLQRENNSLENLWVSRFDTPMQKTVSAIGEVRNLPDGCSRLRVKVAPAELNDEMLSIVTESKVPLMLDFNCQGGSITDVLEIVKRFGSSVEAVEQPFAPGNLVDHALLNREMDCLVSIDEGLRSVADLQLIAKHEAAQMVCLKPARVGGYANARDLALKAADLGIRIYVGGFFESPLARTVNLAFARHVTNEPSDLSNVAFDTDWQGAFDRSISGIGLQPSVGFLDNCEELDGSTISL